MHLKPARYTMAFLVIMLLSGCATLSKEECLQSDWYQLGEKDASRGYIATRITQHNKACQEYNIQVDRQLYQQGYQSGLISYCTKEKGWREGKSGNNYRNICSGQAENNFLRGYEIGYDIYEQEKEINHLQNRLDSIAYQLKSSKLDKKERLELAEEITDVNQDLSTAIALRNLLEDKASAMGFY